MKHYNIPCFIPELACPFQCIYCNQKQITGQQFVPDIAAIQTIIEEHLATIDDKNSIVEIAFFGGNFTGLSLEDQEAYLSSVMPYINDGRVRSIRLSTRPDYITQENLDLLKKYSVETIELGVQTLDDEILKNIKRGYTSADVKSAIVLINESGFRLGLQMMIGLPGDTFEKSLNTAKEFIALGAKDIRIYPTLVIKDTLLEQHYYQKKFEPLSLETAVQWCKELYLLFEQAELAILRVGLHPSEGFINKTSLVAGPFHVSFRELVYTEIWNDILKTIPVKSGEKISLSVPEKEYNYAIGYHSKNKKMLLNNFEVVHFKKDDKLKGRDFYFDII